MNQNRPVITSLPHNQAKMEFVIQYVLARANTIDNMPTPQLVVDDAEIVWAAILQGNPYGLG